MVNVQPVRLPAAAKPLLFVVVDVEEEFDWAGPFSRNHTSVRHLRHINRVQALFDRYGVTPTYVIDYPVASQPEGYEPIKELARHRRCQVGAHLHPWVTPPYSEAPSRRNSFTCMLDPAVQRAKMELLRDVITDNVGITPRIYKAGRYGIGPSTFPILEALGFVIDQSILPHADFSFEGGPSFETFSVEPFFCGTSGRILELPGTSAFVGLSGPAARAIHGLVSLPVVRRTHLGAVTARLRIAEKLTLTPEGFTASEMRRLTRTLLRRGCRVFVLTFHSPSIEAGHTPYVRTARDLDRFLARIDRYLDYYFGAVGGATITPEEFRASVPTSLDGAAASPESCAGGLQELSPVSLD